MIQIPVRTILLLSISVLCCACRGQAGPQEQSTLGSIVSELDKEIWSIYQDPANQYWFGSNGRGVFRYDGKTLMQFTREDGLAGNQIRSIQGDEAGNVYFDTPDGVSKFDPVANNGQGLLTTLKPTFSAVNEWKSEPDDLWFKGNGDINGVYRYDGTSLYHLKFPEFDLKAAYGFEQMNASFSPYGVYSVYRDQQGVLWFGTLSAGVYRYDGVSPTWITEKELTVLEDGRAPGVRSIIKDQDGHFWLSNTLHRYRIRQENGAVSYEKKEGIGRSATQPGMDFPYFISAVTDEKNGDLWLVTYGEGVWRYDGKTLVNYPIKNGEKEVSLFCVYQDRQGMLWLGTHGAGLYRFNGVDFEPYVW